MNKYILIYYNIQIHTDLTEFCYSASGTTKLLEMWEKGSVDKDDAVLLRE